MSVILFPCRASELGTPKGSTATIYVESTAQSCSVNQQQLLEKSKGTKPFEAIKFRIGCLNFSKKDGSVWIYGDYIKSLHLTLSTSRLSDTFDKNSKSKQPLVHAEYYSSTTKVCTCCTFHTSTQYGNTTTTSPAWVVIVYSWMIS